MIVPVTEETVETAARIHAVSWRDAHKSFCSPEFVAEHTPERQKAYLLEKMKRGSRVFLLTQKEPVGIVSVTGSLIEDLYVLPEQQGQGYGTRLLRFAMAQCAERPTLWILDNNAGARRLYEREGFAATGKRNGLGRICELEFVWSGYRPAGASR